jgi:hypothetical protein
MKYFENIRLGVRDCGRGERVRGRSRTARDRAKKNSRLSYRPSPFIKFRLQFVSSSKTSLSKNAIFWNFLLCLTFSGSFVSCNAILLRIFEGWFGFWILVDLCLATMKEEKAREKLRNELWSVRFQLTFG